jgi:hypothetical protein
MTMRIKKKKKMAKKIGEFARILYSVLDKSSWQPEGKIS